MSEDSMSIVSSTFDELCTNDLFSRKVKIAVAQAGSHIFNTPKTLEKLEMMTQQAAQSGAQLILFPETFIGGYPKGIDFGVQMGLPKLDGREEFKRYFDHAISYSGKDSDFIAEVAGKYKIMIAVGVVEKDGTTLFSSVFFYSSSGTRLGKHRKLMPTAFERVVWSSGDGATLPILDTAVGKVCAVICWENYMPMLRAFMYSKGIQIYLAPTVDDREVWLSTMRTIAMEGRCFVISACQYLTADSFPEGHAAHLANQKVFIAGGSCVVNPFGEVILSPSCDREFVKVIECDLAEIIGAKFDLDVVTAHSRPDIFNLVVNEKIQTTVTTKK